MKLKLGTVDAIEFDSAIYRDIKKQVPCLRRLSENRYVLQGKRRSKILEHGDIIVHDTLKENFFVIEREFVKIFSCDP